MGSYKRRILYYWKKVILDRYGKQVKKLSLEEMNKKPHKSEIINFLIKSLNRNVCYLEIGVRNPDKNFNRIIANEKYSVDPGLIFKANPVDFKMTSNEFFKGMDNGEILKDKMFDVILIDGLHLANQVAIDIDNSLRYLKDDGYIVMHDCNPPSEWHGRETGDYHISPARTLWNGTTWKAFVNIRQRTDISSCCVNTDWGVGVLSKSSIFGEPTKVKNPFFEYYILNENREKTLNLISFEKLKKIITLKKA